jgi:hypothetical protein
MYEFFGIPDECATDERLEKKLIYEHGGLSPAEKRMFTEDVERITLLYSLNRGNMNVRPYIDENREYHDIQMIEVRLRSDRKAKKIAEAVFSAMPRPIVIMTSFSESIGVFASHTRINANDRSKTVVEGIETFHPVRPDDESLKLLNIRNMPLSDFLTLYSAIVDAVLKIDVWQRTGVNPDFGWRGAKEFSRELDAVDKEIAEIRSSMKKDLGFREKVDLNERLNNAKDRRRELVAAVQK